MTLAELVPIAPEKKIPAALVAAFLLQTAGALFWACSAAERIATLERTQAADRASIAQVAVVAEQVRAIKDSVERIERKMDHTSTTR